MADAPAESSCSHSGIFACGAARLTTAIANGARFAITTINLGIPSLVVEDAGAALTTLATVVRERIKHCTFIGITGSHGKTTTKDLLGHVLGVAGECIVPPGSFNNEVGVPLTILHVTPNSK